MHKPTLLFATVALTPFLAPQLRAQTQTPPQAAKAPASTSATSASKMTYLDDAEAGGFDVTADLSALPVEWSLVEQENGDGYRLYFNDHAMALMAHRNGKDTVLARRDAKLSPGLVTIQRRGALWRVVMAKRVLLEAENDAWEEGRIGFKGAAKDARVQPIEDVFFDDDFMRVKADVALASAIDNPRNGIRISDVKKDETLWKAVQGTWTTTGLSENAEAQVAQSVNAFAFKTAGVGTNLALAGRAFWNDYSFEAAARPEGADALGLVIYAQDEKNYLSLRWTKHQSDADAGVVQLRAIVNGQARVLAEREGGFEDNQWYRMKVGVTDGVLQAWIDDQEVLSTRTTLFGRGQVGVLAETADKNFALFDDVRVRTQRERHDNFDNVVPGRWDALKGGFKWQKAAVSKDAKLSEAAMGENDWTNLHVSGTLQVPANGSAGLLLRQSKEGTYTLRIGGSKSRDGFASRVQIIKTANGKNTLLSELRSGTDWDNKSAAWTFRAEDGYLRADVDGKRVLDAFDTSLKEGRAGILAAGAAQVRDFSVEFPDVRPTWAKVPELFEQERQAETMGGWSTPQGFWVPARPIADGTSMINPVKTDTKPADPKAPPSTLWHKGTFWGDGSLRFQVPDLKSDQQFAVMLDSPSRATKDTQITFHLDKDVLKADLTRDDANGKAVKAPADWSGSAKLDDKPAKFGVELLQRGSFLIAQLKKDGSEDRTTLLAARVF